MFRSHVRRMQCTHLWRRPSLYFDDFTSVCEIRNKVQVLHAHNLDTHQYVSMCSLARSFARAHVFVNDVCMSHTWHDCDGSQPYWMKSIVKLLLPHALLGCILPFDMESAHNTQAKHTCMHALSRNCTWKCNRRWEIVPRCLNRRNAFDEFSFHSNQRRSLFSIVFFCLN